jgi:hypothetical protein
MRLSLCLLLSFLTACGGTAKKYEACHADSDCAAGLVCRDNGVRCVKAPCPSLSCLDPISDVG